MTEDVFEIFDRALERALASLEVERQSVALGTKLLRQFCVIRGAFVQIALDIREDFRKHSKAIFRAVMGSEQRR